MYEKLDVYDENRNKKGKIIERKEGEILSSDEYILAIQCWIINSNNEILLTKRKATKKKRKYVGTNRWTCAIRRKYYGRCKKRIKRRNRHLS